MTRLSAGQRSKSGFDSPEFDNLANRLLKDYHVPGLSFAVVEGGNVKAKAFGLADVEARIPATPETLYYIGSITKSFVGTSIVKYIASKENQESNRKISLQTPLAEITPADFVLSDDWATRNITFEDALCHRSGSAMHDYTYGGELDSHKAIVRNLRNLPMASPSRTMYEYCNNMYIAASHAIETITGDPISKIVRKQVLDPLGVKDVYVTKADARENGHGETRLYDGYRWFGEDYAEGKGEFVKQEHTDLTNVGGAGYIITNVLEMSKYAKAWLGQSDGLDKAVRDEVVRPLIIDSKLPFGDSYKHYGLGLSPRYYRDVKVVSHTGGLTGYTSFFVFIPSLQWSFIGLGNGDWAQCVEEVLLYHLIDNLLGVPETERYDYVKLNHELIQQITHRDEHAAKKHFPTAPSPGLPLSLPISAYAGTFHNAGYRSFTFSVIDGASPSSPSTHSSQRPSYLQVTAADRTWPFLLQFFHVSGEFWICYQLRGLEERFGQTVDDFKAVSRVGVDGSVQAWGLMIEPGLERKAEREGMGWESGLIWFDRC